MVLQRGDLGDAQVPHLPMTDVDGPAFVEQIVDFLLQLRGKQLAGCFAPTGPIDFLLHGFHFLILFGECLPHLD